MIILITELPLDIITILYKEIKVQGSEVTCLGPYSQCLRAGNVRSFHLSLTFSHVTALCCHVAPCSSLDLGQTEMSITDFLSELVAPQRATCREPSCISWQDLPSFCWDTYLSPHYAAGTITNYWDSFITFLYSMSGSVLWCHPEKSLSKMTVFMFEFNHHVIIIQSFFISYHISLVSSAIPPWNVASNLLHLVALLWKYFHFQEPKFPIQGLNLCPREWKRKVLTTRPPGNAQYFHFLLSVWKRGI